MTPNWTRNWKAVWQLAARGSSRLTPSRHGTVLYGVLLLVLSLSVPPGRANQLNGATAASDSGSGNANDQFLLAKAHLRGEGVPKNPSKAFELMKQAAAQGHADALGGVGYFYATGIAVTKDEEEAVRWFRKGAEKGGAKAQLSLGQMLANGKGAPTNQEEGRKWIERAAAQGLPEAILAHGEILFFGKFGLSPDYPGAFPHLLQSAEAGRAHAQNIVGVMLRDGLGVLIDSAAAESWFRKAAEQGEAKAQSNLGHLIGPDGENAARRIEALKWLMIAARQNEPTATKTLDEVLPHLPKADVAEARKLASGFKNRAAMLAH